MKIFYKLKNLSKIKRVVFVYVLLIITAIIISVIIINKQSGGDNIINNPQNNTEPIETPNSDADHAEEVNLSQDEVVNIIPTLVKNSIIAYLSFDMNVSINSRLTTLGNYFSTDNTLVQNSVEQIFSNETSIRNTSASISAPTNQYTENPEWSTANENSALMYVFADVEFNFTDNTSLIKRLMWWVEVIRQGNDWRVLNIYQ